MSGSRRTPSSRRKLSRKALVLTAIAALIFVDVILVVLALGRGHDHLQVTAPTSPDQAIGPEDKTEAAVQSGEGAAEAAGTVPRLLSVVGDSVAWRSEGGQCDQRGSLQLTVDGGETWGSTYPSSEALGRPLWVSGADFTSVQSAIASGSDCQPEGARTYDTGVSWLEADEVVTNSVLVDPTDPSRVIWGGRSIDGPCEDLTQVAVTRGMATALCSGGQLWSLASDATEWNQSGLDGAVALAASEGRWFAAVESSECNGLYLVEFNTNSVEPLSCVSAGADDESALDVNGNALWIWTGNEVLVSTDLGRSFN